MFILEPATETVAKEKLEALCFAPHDVLTTPAARHRRQWQADRATTLGKSYRDKVDIYLQTADGSTKRLQAIVLDNDDDYLTLKSGAPLPLNCVLYIDFN